MHALRRAVTSTKLRVAYPAGATDEEEEGPHSVDDAAPAVPADMLGGLPPRSSQPFPASQLFRYPGESTLGLPPRRSPVIQAGRSEAAAGEAEDAGGEAAGPEQDGDEDAPREPRRRATAEETWARTPANIRRALLHLHNTTGHPSNLALQRLLRAGKASREAIRGAGALWCATCASVARPATVRPAKLPTTPYEFNYMVQVDVLEEHTSHGVRVSFLNCVCDGTSYQVVVPVRYGGGSPSGKELYETFMTSWVSWAGLPHRLFMDQARNNLSELRTNMINQGVHCEYTALEQPHHPGRCERAGGVGK